MVTYNSLSANDIEVFISNIEGRAIVNMNINTIIGKNTFPINVSGLSKGVYSVRIIDGQSAVVQKLVIE